MATPHDVDFLVAGAGIGGATAALALARQGYSVHVLEQAPEIAELGAGLQIGPNASRVLDHLGVLAEVTKDAFFPRRLVLRDAFSDEQITALDTGTAFTRRYGYGYCVTLRAGLHRTLLEACRETRKVTLKENAEVTAVESDGESAVVTCRGGATYRAGGMIGADGLHSMLRKQLINDGEPINSRYASYRGTKPMAEMRAEAGVGDLDEMVIWTGPGIHFVQYPVRRGQVCNQVASLDTAMFDGAEELDLGEQLDQAFANACPRVHNGVGVMDRSRRWELVDRPPMSGWTSDRIALMGDAAHPMLQYIAQGACQAIEDGEALAANVAECNGGVAAAFKAYETVRLPRASRVQTTARQFGEILHMDGVGAKMRDALLAQRRPDDYTITDWLYGQDVQESLV